MFFPPVSFYNVSLRIHVFFFLREVPQKWGLFWSFSWTSEAFVAVTTTVEVTPTAEPKSLCSAHSHTRHHHLNLTVNYKQNCDASNQRTRHCNQPTKHCRFGYAMLTIPSPPYTKTRSTPFTDISTNRTLTYSFFKEIEKNGKISFLYCLVIRDNHKLRTTVYRKPTLDQSSYNPTAQSYNHASRHWQDERN